MFDIGFWELTIIAIIALVVIGPDRLPEFARTAGLWIGRARRIFANVKRDIDRELQAEELKRMLKPQEFEEIHEIIEETKTTMTDTGTELSRLDASASPSNLPSTEPPESPSTGPDDKSGPDDTQIPRPGP
ncbi:MAG: Sec-independent protein translocase protein TatB [Gammaproteobacteria bacterium]|nr:Sec-independent protein translocase protein TatB [Gammaproteobacteria bacterium]